MKKTLTHITLLILTYFTFTGCNKDEIDTFTTDDSIYFEWARFYINTTTTPIDSLGVTFAYSVATVTDSIFKIPVDVLGLTAPYDRTFTVRVGEGTTVVEGTHYELPESTIVPADSTYGVIAVTFHRTSEMKTDTLMLVLELEPNEYFETTMKENVVNDSDGETVQFTILKLAINDILAQPAKWSTSYFGTFSAKKLLLMNEVTGMPLDALNTTSYSAYWSYWATFFQRWLNDQQAAGNIIYEEDGVTVMTMGASYHG